MESPLSRNPPAIEEVATFLSSCIVAARTRVGVTTKVCGVWIAERVSDGAIVIRIDAKNAKGENFIAWRYLSYEEIAALPDMREGCIDLAGKMLTALETAIREDAKGGT